METNVDFDALARKSNESGGAVDVLNNLFGATFALEKWLFIARGVLPNVNPYIAANADYAGGQQMIRAFTDAERLQRFARENNLTEADGSAQMLTVPTVGIVEYLEQFINSGVHGVWFNSDTVSDGYFIPLKQLRPIKEHLAKINWQSVNQPTDPTLPHNSGFVPPVASSKSAEQSAEIKTAVVMMQDGLMSSDNVFTPSARTYFCFCRIPMSWTDGERVKNLVSEKLFEIVYRETWNTKKPPEGSRYIVPQPKSKVYSQAEAGNLDWKTLQQETVGDVLFLFYIANENGELREVTETKFRAEIEHSKLKHESPFDVLPPLKKLPFADDLLKVQPIKTEDSKYAPIDLQTIDKPTYPIEVRATRFQNWLLVGLIAFFGFLTFASLSKLFRSQFTTTTDIIYKGILFHGSIIALIFVFIFFVIRAKRKSVRAFDKSGVTRGDGKHFLWSDFRGAIQRIGRNRYGGSHNWRTELVFANGGVVWVIPQRIKNYDEIYGFVNTLPPAILKDNNF